MKINISNLSFNIIRNLQVDQFLFLNRDDLQ